MEHSNTTVVAKNPLAGGVDSGKLRLDAALAGDKATLACDNTPEGRMQLVAFFKERGVARVGIEASGGYEMEAVAAMRAAGIEVVVFQPAQVRAYAKFLNQKAKTDRIDAAIIARCVEASPNVRCTSDPRLVPLAEHLTYIDQIVEDIARLATRRDRYREPRLKAGINDEIKRLTKLRKLELRQLAALVKAHADLAERLKLLLSIDGLGERTALTLVIRMPELGSMTNAQAAALAGMAPVTRESGRWKGESHVEGGPGRVGKAVFAAAQAASQRWNKQLIELYQRLMAKGKHHSVAVVACARKMIVYANTVLARGAAWTKMRPETLPQAA